MSRRIDRYQNRQIKNIKKELHRMKMNQETKYHETYLAGQTPAITGSLNVLNAIAVGDDQVSRDGAECRCTSLRFILSYTSTIAAAGSVVFRVLIFWDTQCNGVVPTVAGNPLTGTTAVLNNRVTTDLVYAPRQLENADRFDFVYDKVHTINPNFEISAAGDPYPWDKHIIKNFKFNRIVQFDNTTGVVASMNKNALYVLVIAQDANVAFYDLSAVVYFKDD